MKEPRKFVVLALPRSRTTWLSEYLSAGGRKCGHDTLIHCADYEGFLGQFVGPNGLAGTCETAGMLGWKLLRHAMPEANLIVVRRDPEMVKKSLRQCGWDWPEVARDVDVRAEMLEAVSRAPGVWTVGYDELYDGEVMKRLWELCVGREWDEDHWVMAARQNIQINMTERARFLVAHSARLTAFKEGVLAEARLLGGSHCLGLN